MAQHRTPLYGRRGWTTVVSLTAVLAGLVAVQLPVANAEGTRPVLTATSAPATSAPAASALLLPDDERVAPRPVGWPTPPAAPAPVVAIRAAVVPAPVPVPAADACSGPGWEQRRGAAALASLRGGAERTGFAVAFEPAKSGYLGLTHLQERRIDLHVRSCEKESTELLRHVMAHELGHAWDTTLMSEAKRVAYQAARGIPASTPWYGCSGCTDFATPAGDFAEVYAQWARSATTNRSELAGDVPAAELAALASEFFGA